MRVKRGILLVLAFALICSCALAGADSITSDDVRYSINGNANGFGVNEKTGKIRLADCIVTSVRAHRTTWELPGEFANKESVQKVFDMLTESEIVDMTENRLEGLYKAEWDYLDSAGIAISFESTKGASVPPSSQKDGQGYGTLVLIPFDASEDESLKDMVKARLDLYTNKGISNTTFYVSSQPLTDLILRMSRQNYEGKELASAQTLDIVNCQALEEYAIPLYDGDMPYASTSDRGAIKALYDVFVNGEKMALRLKTTPEWLMRFTMPDGTIRAAYITQPAIWEAPVMEKYRGDVFVTTGKVLYRIDREKLDAAFETIGLTTDW